MNIEKENLVEIYTLSEEIFSVGMRCYGDDDWEIYATVDPRGIVDGYFAIRKSAISSISCDTKYLNKIKSYMNYAEEHSYHNWFDLRRIEFYGDVVRQIIGISEKEKNIITVKRANVDELYEGFVVSVDDDVTIECIDISCAEYFEEAVIPVAEIECIIFGTIDQVLLRYAYDNNDTGVKIPHDFKFVD